MHIINGIVSDEQGQMDSTTVIRQRWLGHKGRQVTSAQTWDVSYSSDVMRSLSPVLLNIAPADPVAYCTVVLAPVLESAREARDFTKMTLRGWKLDALISEAVIIASELVANAIRHGTILQSADTEPARVGLAWQRQVDRVICVVTDRSVKAPMIAEPDLCAESGRGLQVVQALAAAWGWMMLGAQEKAVWAALAAPLATPRTWTDSGRL